MTDHGTYQEIGGRPAVVFERTLPHPVERVWRALTDLQELQAWFPDGIAGEIAPGGALRFGNRLEASFDGEVLVLEPHRRFHLRWGPEEVHLDLERAGDGSRLRLTNVLLDRDEAARNAGGWEVCLADLDAHLDGAPRSALDWRAVYDGYLERGLPSGAEVPG